MGFFSLFSKKPAKIYTAKCLDEMFSKELLIDVLNSSHMMMLIYSKEDGWIGANKNFCLELGYKDISDFRRQHDSIRDIFLSESEEIFVEGDGDWLEYLKTYKSKGYRTRLYNAKEQILEINLKCTRAQSTKSMYILEFEDVSQLEFANEQIKEVEELKTKFLANIGHEFRTPMNGIIGFLELLSNTKLDQVQTEYIQLIGNSSRSLMSNIETLLDLSQMQGGRLTVDNESFALVTHMEELIYQHIIVARDKGIKVLSFIDPKLPKDIYGDIRKIKQIINSLIQNAIKFTARGGRVVVEVKLLKRQMNGDCSIGFGIRDNGKGISKRELSRILEPFSSGDHADERLGVGLSLSHGLVKLFGSEMHIQSEEGEGSYFNFVLDFKATKGQSYKMMPKKKVKVLLLDKTKIDEANFLSSYLRAFSIDVVKSNVLDDKIYDDIDVLYIVADQNDSSWMLKLGTFGKKAQVVLLLEENEKLQTKLTHVVSQVLRLPLFASKVSQHLSSIHGILLQEKEKKKLEVKDKVATLVVEDNLINQRLMQIMLKEYDISVKIASNGNEAIEMCQKNRFDIVFMDIDMPEKNGIVATQEIKQTVDLNGKTPIVALTAMAMQGDREMLISEGLDDYMSKPITKDKLEAIMNKYLKALFV